MLIHVTKGQITIRVNDEEINFNIKVAMKHPLHLDYCFKANIVDQVVQQTMELIKSFISFEQVIKNVIGNLDDSKRKELEKCLSQLKFLNSKELLKRREMRKRKTT